VPNPLAGFARSQAKTVDVVVIEVSASLRLGTPIMNALRFADAVRVQAPDRREVCREG